MKCPVTDCETESKESGTHKDIQLYECEVGHRFGFVKDEEDVVESLLPRFSWEGPRKIA